jgi:uncharacterized protein YuzE
MIIKSNITKQFTMEQDYDFIGDSLLLYITEKYNYKRSVRLTDDVILDFDDNDMPVALELLNASKILKVKKSSLKKPVGVDMYICVGENRIRLEAKLFVTIHEKEISKPLIEETPNNANLIANEAHFARATA